MLLFISQALDIVLACTFTKALSVGIGHDQWTLSWDQMHEAGYRSFVSTAISLYPIALPKFAIALLLVRLLSPSKPTVILLYASATFIVLLSILNMAILLAQCTPIEYTWNKMVGGHCINFEVFTVISLFTGGK